VPEPLGPHEVSALAEIFSEPLGARQLLRAAGWSDARVPSLRHSNAAEFWGEVSWLLGGGILPDGRGRLLAAARERFPANPVFADPSPAGTRDGSVSDGGTTRSGESERVWMMPPVPGPVVDRPELADTVVGRLLASGAGPVGLATSVEGGGGFGKTTLAIQVCHRPEIGDRFPGGVLWATVGQDRRDSQLVDMLDQLCVVLGGRPAPGSDPVVAGARLGQLLDGRPPTLLVVDDVWRPDQLEPFLVGGRDCRRLVTTRNAGIVPREAGGPVMVDQMTDAEAKGTLVQGVQGLPEELAGSLIAACGRYPLLLGLVNGQLSIKTGAGGSATAVADWLVRQLAELGPTAFDDPFALDDPERRHAAVAATIELSLAVLDPGERRHVLSLAVFPEDVDLPASLVDLLWQAAGGLTAADCRRLRNRVARLRLAGERWDDRSGPALRLHDVIRSYLLGQLDVQQLAYDHTALLTAARSRLTGGGEPTDNVQTAWWTLPDDDPVTDYLWRYVPYHLSLAGLAGELDQLVCDPRWIAAKTRRFGGTALVEADLALLTGSPVAGILRRALAQASHLLGAIDPPAALDATLASRLDDVPGLEPVIDAYRASLARPHLAPAWPLPDQPDPREIRTMTGHTGPVLNVMFSPDGQLLASVEHGMVHLWETASGRQRAVLAGRTGRPARAVAFSPDGQMLATVSNDETVQLWETATGTSHSALSGHVRRIQTATFAENGRLLATGDRRGTVQLWDITNGSRKATRTIRTRRRLAVARHDQSVAGFSSDGLLFATGGRRQRKFTFPAPIRLRETTSGRKKATLACWPQGLQAAVFSPDGRLLATLEGPGHLEAWHVRLLNTAIGEPHARRWISYGPARPASSVAFSCDSRLIAIAGHDGTVRLRETPDGAVYATLSSKDTGEINAVAFSPDGQLLATGDDNGQVRLWDMARIAEKTVPGGGRASGVETMAFSPDGRLLATGDGNGVMRLWNATRGTPHATLSSHVHAPRIVAFSPDGRLLATGDGDGVVRLWNTTSGTERAALSGHPGGVRAVAFSPDGRLLATGGADRVVRLWDMAGGAQYAALIGHTDRLQAMTFSPDGRLLATVGADRTVRVWDRREGLCLAALRVTDDVSCVGWQPYGDLLAVAGTRGLYMLRYVS
jgi:WD40 repeat protein